MTLKRAALKERERSALRLPTSDDWYPNFEDGTVELSFLELSDDTWRVCVWGNDDYGAQLRTTPATPSGDRAHPPGASS